MPLSINYTGQSKILSYNKLNRYISLSRLDGISTENFIYYNKSKAGFSLKNELNSYDGIKNGIVVIGNYFRNIVVGSTLDYLNGFDVICSNAKIYRIYSYDNNTFIASNSILYLYIVLFTYNFIHIRNIICLKKEII